MSVVTIKSLLRLGRLGFPVSGLLFFAFGSLLAVKTAAVFDALRYLVAGIMVFSANLSISFSNDYFDVEADKHNQQHRISGGSGVLIEHPELRGLAYTIALTLIALCVSLAIVLELVYCFNGTLMALVALGNVLGWYYSAPPLRLSCRGLSEVVVIVTVGFLLPGTGYLILKKTWDAVFLCISPLCILYSLAFIISVEIPDVEADRRAGKRTLVVEKGRDFSCGLLVLVFLLATLYIILLQVAWNTGTTLNFWPIACFSLIPLASGVIGFIQKHKERATALQFAAYNVYSLIALLVLVNLYLITS